MRLAWLLLLCACSDKKQEQPPPSPKPVPIDAADWRPLCEEALTAKLTPVRKLAMVIEKCQPCGDWKPLLDWNTAPPQGPSEEAIEGVMTACKAWCTGNAKTQFLGVLEDARGKPGHKPWRTLGELCKDAVSAAPDVRFMSAPYFALDRIARATAADPKLAPLAAALELPLPPVSFTGIGFELPDAAVTKPDIGKFQVTVTMADIHIGTLPIAKLGNGVTVDVGKTPYPGDPVVEKDLAKQLDALTGDPKARVAIIAATGVPASRVFDVVKAAGTHELVLAVAAGGGPKGWTFPGYVPVTLDVAPSKAFEWKLDAGGVDQAIADLKSKPAEAFASPRVTIAKDAKVADLAKLLGALAFRDAHSVSLAMVQSKK